jgi:hypothetical protein
MGVLVDLRGVATWHEISGTGEPVVLLHGAFTNGDFFALQVSGARRRGVDGSRP